MKQYLASNNHKDVEVLIIPVHDTAALAQLQWEGETEFGLNGEMYDVLQKTITANKLIIRCISDTKETALLKDYEQINKENNNPSKQKSASLIKLITTYFEPIPLLSYFHFPASDKSIYISFKSTLFFHYPNVLTPPPQTASVI